ALHRLDVLVDRGDAIGPVAALIPGDAVADVVDVDALRRFQDALPSRARGAISRDGLDAQPAVARLLEQAVEAGGAQLLGEETRQLDFDRGVDGEAPEARRVGSP